MPTSTAFLSLVTQWMRGQRWFAGKGHEPLLRSLGEWELPSDQARVRVHLLMDDAATPPVLYQVPITERREPLATGEAALIGTVGDAESLAYLYDGPRDPAFAWELLRMLASGHRVTGRGVDARGVSLLPEADVRILSSRVHAGEQSNTSIIYEVEEAGTPVRVICKVFRALHHGENPDVVLQSALAEAGSTHVPRSVGSLVGEWDDAGRPGGRAEGHLAFAQEFLTGMEDGWAFALRAAASGDDFSARAHSLGAATAEIHAVLARVMPSRPPTSADIDGTLASWRRRLDTALRDVPDLERFRDAAEALYADAAALEWPLLQRVHGDYHLGQVLIAPDGRWVALDFEGEPLRPMAERSEPDFAVRDIAGMLRSFDYVAGAQGNTPAALGWAQTARAAFLAGYGEASATDVSGHRGLLDAFELDKAMYEVMYEARNRPGWVGIPLGGIERLLVRTQRS